MFCDGEAGFGVSLLQGMRYNGLLSTSVRLGGDFIWSISIYTKESSVVVFLTANVVVVRFCCFLVIFAMGGVPDWVLDVFVIVVTC